MKAGPFTKGRTIHDRRLMQVMNEGAAWVHQAIALTPECALSYRQ